jgi:hypothetical protein
MDENGKYKTYNLDRELMDMLQDGVDEESPNLDITIQGYQDYNIEEIPERWTKMQVLRRPAAQVEAQRAGGADSNLVYNGDDPEELSHCQRIGIGVNYPESCFIRALEQVPDGVIPKKTLTRLKVIIRCKFLPLELALKLMKELEIPVKLRSWDATERDTFGRPSQHPKREAKHCPGGKADYEIQLYLSHYFLGNWQDVNFLDDL